MVRLTPDQQTLLENIQLYEGKPPAVLVHVYGPGKRSLLAMEKKGILKIQNKKTWSKTNRAEVKLLPPWNSLVQKPFHVTLQLTMKEVATLNMVLRDIDMYYEYVIANRRRACAPSSVYQTAIEEIEEKRKLAKALADRVRDG